MKAERYPFPRSPYPGGGETIVVELKKTGIDREEIEMPYTYVFLPGYEQVYDIFEGDYSWSELRVFRQENSGRLFYAAASGCSCYSYEDEISESDLIELQSLSGAQNAVKEFLGESSSHTYMNAVEALRGLGLR